MGYSACCFIIDVNMFWIFILFGFFPCSHKQLCLLKFLIFCTNGSSLFLTEQSICWHCNTRWLQAVPNMSRLLLLFSWDWGQVDITLHRRQRFNLASRPASLSLPQAAWRANAEPAIAAGFADDLFVVVDVGHASHCDHTGLQHLSREQRLAQSTMCLWRDDWIIDQQNLTWTCCFDGSWTIAVPFTLRSKTPLVPVNRDNLLFINFHQNQHTNGFLLLWIATKKCTYPITCSTNVLWSLPWLYLQVVHQRAHRKSSQRVRVTLIGWDCSAIKEIPYELVSITDCSNQSSPGKVCTCHTPNKSRCFDDVSSLHVLCSNDPSFPVAPSYQRDVSRPVETIMMADCMFIPSMHVDGSAVWWKLSSPARVITHFHNLLFKRLGHFAWFEGQSLKVYHPVFLFMATADAVCPNPSCVAERKMSRSFGLFKSEYWTQFLMDELGGRAIRLFRRPHSLPEWSLPPVFFIPIGLMVYLSVCFHNVLFCPREAVVRKPLHWPTVLGARVPSFVCATAYQHTKQHRLYLIS